MAGLQELLVEPATVVTTAAELKDAVAAGVPHIEIRQHLDLRDGAPGNPMPVDPALLAGAGQLLPLRRLQDAGQKLPVLGTVSDTLRAIRVSSLALVPTHGLLRCKGVCQLYGQLNRTADDGMWLHCAFPCANFCPHMYPCESRKELNRARLGAALASHRDDQYHTWSMHAQLHPSRTPPISLHSSQVHLSDTVDPCIHLIREHVHVDSLNPTTSTAV